MSKKILNVAVGLALGAITQMSWAVVNPQTYVNTGPNTWVHNANPADRATGSIIFNDWGYTGPTGVGVNSFQVGTGFDSSRIGQIQEVTTLEPDWLTPDPTRNVKPYIGVTTWTDANMDGNVNFYKMAYTTPTSTFSNMQIDKAGNYYIPKADMQFGFYDTFLYNNGSTVSAKDTDLNFQPYPISDAIGWCGSVLTSGPNSLEVMAGQVTFDFAFDAYFGNSRPETGGTPATQIVPGFVMRSYGDYYVNVTNTPSGYNMNFEGHAVGNNTNPTTVVAGVGGTVDPAYQNRVSFLGAGIVPRGVWIYNAGTPDITVAPDQTYVEGAQPGDVRASDGATWHANDFAGFAFLLRADAGRVVTYINPDGWSDYGAAAVPVPGAVWLFGSGLLGLVGIARRTRRHNRDGKLEVRVFKNKKDTSIRRDSEFGGEINNN